MSLSRKEKIVIFAVILFVCVIVVGSRIYEKKQSEPKAKNRFFENPFSEVDPGIDQQSGNYANDALVCFMLSYDEKSPKLCHKPSDTTGSFSPLLPHLLYLIVSYLFSSAVYIFTSLINT